LNQKKNAGISLNKSKNALWESIRKTLFPVCTTEWCWLDHVDADKKMKEETFRPAMPIEWVKNKYEWLSTTDINEVMVQYEKKYNNFRFFGPVPVDCPKDIYCELTDLDIKGLKSKGIDYIGVVFNLDRHDQSGSHWVALYINIPKSLITYYDSTASEPPEYIKYFINMVGIKLNQLNGKYMYDYNKKKHQYGGSECGMYSMNFLIESLKGKTLKDFESKQITDREVNLLRNYLYRPPKKMESHIGGQAGGRKKEIKPEKKKITKKTLDEKTKKKKITKKTSKDKPKK
jgi:hypothetical protein